MTNHEPPSPLSPTPKPGARDLSELSRAILDGERVSKGPPPPPMPERRIMPAAVGSLKVPAIVTQILLAAWIPFAGVAVAFVLMQRSLLHRVGDDPTSVRYSEVLADNHRIDAINAVFLGLLIVTAVAFVVWFHRAYRNLDALDSRRRYGAGWAIGGWLVPIMSLFVPKRIADDIWDANDTRSAGAHAPGMPRPKSALIFCWWGAWILSNVLGFAAARANDPTTLQEAMNQNSLYLARDLVLVVPAVLAVLVVRRITKAQNEVVAAARARGTEKRG